MKDPREEGRGEGESDEWRRLPHSSAVNTCGGFSIHRAQEVAIVQPIESDHIGGAGTEPGHEQTEGVAREREVLALGAALQVGHLYDKALKLALLDGPGHVKAVPGHIGHRQVPHLRLPLL